MTGYLLELPRDYTLILHWPDCAGMMAAFESECWPDSNRNGGRFPAGTVAGFVRNTQLRKLDKQIARQIVEYMDNIAALEDPCGKGKVLKGTLGGLWRYRVEDWRVVCDIQNDQVVILVLRVGHRSKVYGGH